MMNNNKPQQQQKKKKQCYFCANNNVHIDYKDVKNLRRYLSSFAKIVARKRSGVCMKHQRELSNAIKRARVMALIPFTQR
jgi:small subunit ribosomal protein S18